MTLALCIEESRAVIPVLWSVTRALDIRNACAEYAILVK